MSGPRRIMVITSGPPLAEGGHLVMARGLVQALREEGHSARLLLTPQNRFGRQGAAYLANWLTDVGVSEGQRIDQVISLRYPAYAVRHEHHVCWLNHTMREYYDLWGRFSAGLRPHSRLKEGARRLLIRTADRYLLSRRIERLFVISKTVQDRLSMWPELRPQVLYPPAPQRAYRCDAYGDYILWVSRLTPLKRADLLIEALATEEGRGIEARIAGDGEDRARLERLIRDRSLEGRVRLIGAVSDDALLDHLAGCRAVCFPPLDEDYGFVTVEAFASRKPVVTCRDSGGPAELVEDGVNGFVCEPTASALAVALRKLWDDPASAERMGSSAAESAAALTWPDAVRRLTT